MDKLIALKMELIKEYIKTLTEGVNDDLKRAKGEDKSRIMSKVAGDLQSEIISLRRLVKEYLAE